MFLIFCFVIQSSLRKLSIRTEWVFEKHFCAGSWHSPSPYRLFLLCPNGLNRSRSQEARAIFIKPHTYGKENGDMLS